jgi:D-amino-acid dehydrogenase
MFAAHYLLKDGHQVTVVDENPQSVPTSVYNAGLLMPSAGALPTIGLSTILSAYVGRQGPVYISLGEVTRNLGWFRVGLRKGLHGFEEALTWLGESSLALYSDFFEEVGVDVDHLKGIVSLYRDRERAKRAASLSKARFVDAEEVSRMGFQNVGGGAYLEDESSINPFKLFEALRSRLRAQGAEFELGGRAEISASGGHATSVKTDRADTSGDRYLIAAGSWSRELSRSLGFDIPLLPARGMAMIFDTGGEEIVSVSALLEDDGVGVTQHNENTLRLTSFFEMVGFKGDFSQKRREWFTQRAKRYITKFDGLVPSATGVGFRPCTPDQLPIIGRIPGYDNVYMATGNCRLGVTLAPATANIVRLMIRKSAGGVAGGVEDDPHWAHFDPARFASRDRRQPAPAGSPGVPFVPHG